jgi:uncharacterized OB-fold protein
MTGETVTPAPPPPSADADSAEYWAALREHRVRVRVCLDCARTRLLPTPSCPFCGHPAHRSEDSAGNGTVYSFITVRRALDPAFANEVPYSIATIDLDDRARALGRLIGTPAVGARVSPVFVDHSDWTELRFLVSEARCGSTVADAHETDRARSV